LCHYLCVSFPVCGRKYVKEKGGRTSSNSPPNRTFLRHRDVL